MESYQKYIALAKELGIPQEDIFQWCETKVTEEKEREDKARERDEKAKEREKAKEDKAKERLH